MTTLYPTIITFFETKMAAHSCVELCTRMPIVDEYIFEIKRMNERGAAKVFLSDAYRFGLAEYLSRPAQIGSGDFILIAKPEGNFDDSLLERARRDRIAIGKIGKLMGALNVSDMSKYQTPEEIESQRLNLER